MFKNNALIFDFRLLQHQKPKPTATYTPTAAAAAATTSKTSKTSKTARTSRTLPSLSHSEKKEDMEEELPNLRNSPGTSRSINQSFGESSTPMTSSKKGKKRQKKYSEEDFVEFMGTMQTRKSTSDKVDSMLADPLNARTSYCHYLMQEVH